MLIRRVSNAPGWTPLFREFDRLFDSLGVLDGPREASLSPDTRISETDEAVFVHAELPGIDPAELDITVEDDTLTIVGERKQDAAQEGASYRRRERRFGKFRKSFALDGRVDASAVRARYRDGILTVELPKPAELRPRQIAVEAQA